MELFEKRLFEEVLNMAVSRFSERIVQRCQGTESALQLLKTNSEADGVWLKQFVENFFLDNLLNDCGGASFILQSLERRKLTAEALQGMSGSVGEVMQLMARHVFADLVKAKTIESLEQSLAYGGS